MQKNTDSRSLTQKYALPTSVLLLGFLAVLSVFYILRQQNAQYVASEFTLSAERLVQQVEKHMHEYGQVLRGGQALYAASNSVERNEWEQYYTALNLDEYLPGIQAFAYSKYIRSQEEAETITEQIRSDGFSSFTIYPATEGRQELHSIIYIQPMDKRNLQAFGFDMGSESIRRQAMHSAQESGEPKLSGAVTLVQEITDDVQAGTLLYMPVYTNGLPVSTVSQRNEALEGFVYAAFRMGDLFEAMTEDMDLEDLDFFVTDITPGSSPVLLYTNQPEEEDYLPRYENVFTLDVFGRIWEIRVHASEYFNPIQDQPTSWLIFVMGVVINILIFFIFVLSARTQFKARKIAERMTEMIRTSKDRLTAIYRISSASSNMSMQDQMEQLLAIGCEEFGLDLGVISRIDGDQFTVEYVYGHGADELRGKTLPLGNTYCSITLNSDDVVAIGHFGESKHKMHPCYKERGLESYIAIKLEVNGKQFGTLNFTSVSAREQEFSEEDKELMRLVAKFVASSIEREQNLQSLQSQRDELQRANDLMVNRELKMKEMKAEIDRFRGNISSTSDNE